FRADQVEPQSGLVYYYSGATGRMNDDDAERILQSEVDPILRDLEFVWAEPFKDHVRKIRKDRGDWLGAVQAACDKWPGTQSRRASPICAPRPRNQFSFNSKTCSKCRARNCPSASLRLAKRFATKSIHAILHFAPGSLSKWSWNIFAGQRRG